MIIHLHSKNGLLLIKLKILEFFQFLTLRLTLKPLNIGLVSSVNRAIIVQIKSTIKDLEEILEKVDSLKIEEAKNIYPRINSAFIQYRKTFSKIESIRFFKSKQNLLVAEQLLDLFYEVEFKLRIKIYSDQPSSGKDEELKDFATRISIHAASSVS